MYDIHSHIIYGVDDGASNIEVSRRLLEIATKSGTKHIVATPHIIETYNHLSWKEINAKVNELRELAIEDGLELQIYPGSEVMLSLTNFGIYDEEDHAFCINNTDYALVELPMFEVPNYTEEFFYRMQLRGLRPILAHAERYLDLYENVERLLEWCRRGVLLQINGDSLLGKFGREIQRNAEFLLSNQLISFIGSDAHSVIYRNTNLEKARFRLLNLVGDAYAERICIHNPKALLANEFLNVDLPSKTTFKLKKSFWQKIFH